MNGNIGLQCGILCSVLWANTNKQHTHACTLHTHTWIQYILFFSLSSLAKSECINLSICQNGIVVVFAFFSRSFLHINTLSPFCVFLSVQVFFSIHSLVCVLFCSFQWTPILTCMFVYIATILHAFLTLCGVCVFVFLLHSVRLRHILVRQYH